MQVLHVLRKITVRYYDILEHIIFIAENRVSFTCHIKRGHLDFQEEDVFELVQFVGYFRKFCDCHSSRMDYSLLGYVELVW
jgi:hypothetical protein